MSNLTKELQSAINCNSAERPSDTPDFILAEFLTDCLAAWNKATLKREAYYGRAPMPVKEIPVMRPERGSDALGERANPKAWD